MDITGSHLKLLKLSHGLLSPGDGAEGIELIASVTFIFVIPAVCRHPNMQFVIHAFVVSQDVWVSASDRRHIKCHFGDQIVKMNGIINTCHLHADNHGRRWVLRLSDLTLDCSKSVFIHPLLLALW